MYLHDALVVSQDTTKKYHKFEKKMQFSLLKLKPMGKCKKKLKKENKVDQKRCYFKNAKNAFLILTSNCKFC